MTLIKSNVFIAEVWMPDTVKSNGTSQDEVFTEHAGYRLIWPAETEAFGAGLQEEFPFLGLHPVVKSQSKTGGSRR